jgi:hypothetical protein
MITDTQYRRFILRNFFLFLVIGLFVISIGCARKGLISKEHSREFYQVHKLLPDKSGDKNPKFIFYGDSRPGWRIKEKFLEKENWYTWKMMFFPFYGTYWLGNGLVGGINWLRRAPDYGAQERRMVRDAIYAEAKRSKVDFIIHGGDMPVDGRRSSHWETFLQENKIERPLILDFPFLPVIGNHEKTNDGVYGLPNYEAIFDYPPFYVLDFPDVALFVIDSNLIIDQYQFINDDEQDALFEEWFISGKDSKNSAWLERELASRNQTFKIVVMHHPPISFAKHHSDWLNPLFGRNIQEKRKQLFKLFYEKEVQVVLCSHEHYYEHNIIRYSPNGNKNRREIHFVVSGGGGAPLSPIADAEKRKKLLQNYRDEEFDLFLLKQAKIYNYCLVEIASDKVIIQVMEVTKDAVQPVKIVDKILIPKLSFLGERQKLPTRKSSE